MTSSSDRQRAQLTIPQVPKFPFSSPITEEIASPTPSSDEDRDMERNRPFEFLAKVSSKNPFTHKAASDRIREFEQGVSGTIGEQEESTSSSFTARRNPDRPVGLNLDIPASTSQPRKETAGAFVDLNDLKVLSKAREEERSAQKVKGILKNQDIRWFKRIQDDAYDEEGGKKGSSLLDPVLKSTNRKARDDGISPTDRPIVIGYSVPFDSPELQDGKTKELDSAGTLHTPLTPSIIVTPAKEDGFWSHLSPVNTRPRAASSVYSRPTSYRGPDTSDAPPVPALPALYSTGNDESKSGNVRKRRSLSTSAVNEKVEYRSSGRRRSRSIEKTRPADNLTIDTSLNTRASHGWWNYILSPLLSRTSTLLSRGTPTETRPPLPTIETHSTGLSDEWWDEKEKWNEKEKYQAKEISVFSPDTPQETEAHKRVVSWQATNGNPFSDFDWSIDEQSRSPQERGVASMPFSGGAIQGAAAEYYQACAHELFSGTPYFECVDHVCSITPKDKIPVVESSPPIQPPTEGGLLIDLDDMPRSNDLQSPNSGITSINSSPSDEASVVSRGLRTSLKSSRAPPIERVYASPPRSPYIPDAGNARQLDSSPEPQDTTQSTNPFLQQPREAPAPFPNYNFQQSAPQPPPNINIESAPAPAPADIHIQAPAAQPAPNIYFQMPAPPVAPAAPEYPEPAPIAREAPASPAFVPPPNMPPPSVRADRMPPPGYGVQMRSPYPRSPESLQENTRRGGSIQMSTMPAGPAPAYTPHDNTALPPRARAFSITREELTHPLTERDRIENRRRRHEREEALGQKVGGWWRGRGPFSNKGCFGRKGREGRMKRRWYFAIVLFFIGIVLAAILLAVFLTRNGDGTPVQSQWLNLTGYPPMPTGISTIAGPEAQVQESGCINPASMWSCALPKEQQSANKPYSASQPNFRVEIRFQNGSYDHSTAIASRSLHMLSRSTNQLFNPSPSAPSTDEQTFLGRTTDNTSKPYAGEETPFYLTVLSTQHLSSSQLSRRDTELFPDLSNIVPSPAVDSDGTAAPAVLYPFPSSQPVRLYNRGEDTEHYGFYSYFDKSVFLSSSFPIGGPRENSANDTSGGSTKADASVRCTWAQTRFLVQIWTKGDKAGKTLFDRTESTTNTTTSSSTDTDSSSATETASSSTSSSSATDFIRPGSFPYPVTITLDRHGGDANKKMVYCYGMESDMHVNSTEVKLQLETRGYNGQLINPTPGIFDLSNSTSSNSTSSSSGSDDEEGGYDGGTGGCKCQWVNWIGAV
ncbi:hypothetical protein BJX99DRAFT_248017 [Aspergillus californicus]